MDHIQINAIEKFHFDNFTRIVQNPNFRLDLNSIEDYIITNYDKLHFHWGIKNKIKLAAERLVRFHVWRNSGLTGLYKTPLSSDVAYEIGDCIINIDCKTIDLNSNSVDTRYIQCEPNQANFENIPLFPTKFPEGKNFSGFKFYPILEKFFEKLPVLSFFVHIIYEDDGNNFRIDRIELLCLPHNEIVKNQFDSNIIQNFKTYDYLDDKRSMKFGDYFKPKNSIQDHWEEVTIGRTTRYFDKHKLNPVNEEPLIWGKESNKYKVINGGHTIRISKELVKNRTIDGNPWSGHLIIN